MPDLVNLPVSERIKLVQDLWDSIAADTGAVPVCPEDLAETRRRLAEYRVDHFRGEPAREAAEVIRRSL
jgi:putative addiction module component (TIGR02574 family)